MSNGLLESLMLVVQFYNLSADIGFLQREYDPEGKGFDSTAGVRAARSVGFRAKRSKLNFQRVEQWALPALIEGKDGNWFVLAGCGSRADDPDKRPCAIIHRPGGSPEQLALEDLQKTVTGTAIFLTPREAAAAGRRHFDLSWFMPMMVKYRHQIGEVLLASFFVNVLGLALPIVMQVIFDKVLVHGSTSTLTTLMWVMVVVTIFTVLGGMLRAYLQDHATRRMDVELGSSVFRRLLSLPQAYFDTRQVGQTVARLGELDTIRAFLTQAALTALLDLLFVFVYLLLMWYYSPLLTWIVIGSLLVYLLVAVFVAPRLRAQLRAQFEIAAKQQSLSVETVGSMKMLKVFGMEARMQSRWSDLKAEHAVRSFKASQTANVGSHLVQGTSQFTTVAVIGLGVLEVIKGSMTAGSLIAFNMLSGRVAQPMLRLGQLWQEFQEAGLAIDRLGDIMNVPPEQENVDSSQMPGLRGELEFKSVTFTYPGRIQPALREVSFRVDPGQRIGIAGESGSGKSTLAMLSVRMFLPDEGAILTD
ncbi:MAG: ABC transporter transmembrane domain-containing protein, partial [Betaproteobacteria bacterium]|nr:ABC transporter transmembrane domain-containing protein [Betaproteobacteria bacterium]